MGRPVVDLLRKSGLECTLVPVTISGGDSMQVAGDYYREPKKDLISGLQLLLQQNELKIAGKLELGWSWRRNWGTCG